MKLTKSLLIILVTGAAVLAQGPPPPGGGEFGRMAGGMPGGPGFGPRGHKLVTGAAYTADVNATQTRTLPDGNVIQHTMSGKVARDAAGRTYTMHTSTGGPLGQTGTVTRISIVDPVAGYSYELDPAAKTAVRREIHQPPAGGGPGADFRGANPNAQARPADPNLEKKDLGSQMINGVVAQGKSHTRTVPAGANGNAKPIVSTSETWISPDLQVVVSAKMSDPRVGESVYALTNIQKTADASLFQVPAGYTITDGPKGRGGGLGGRMGRRPPPPPPQE
jgi:hypothetical protein